MGWDEGRYQGVEYDGVRWGRVGRGGVGWDKVGGEAHPNSRYTEPARERRKGGGGGGHLVCGVCERAEGRGGED